MLFIKKKLSNYQGISLRILFKRVTKTDRAQIAQKMAQTAAKMKQTMTKTTPRSFALLFILSTLPSFYFLDQIISLDYNDNEYVPSYNRFYKYYYFYNLVFYSCGFALSRFNFHTPSSKYTIQKRNIKSALIPFIWSFLGFMLPQTDSKHLIWPAILTQISTTVVQGIMTNRGTLPFWFYSYRHYIGMFYFFMFVVNTLAIFKLERRRISHPHEFVQIKE